MVSRSTQFLNTDWFFLKTISLVVEPYVFSTIGISSVLNGEIIEWPKYYVLNISSLSRDAVSESFLEICRCSCSSGPSPCSTIMFLRLYIILGGGGSTLTIK
jgi:hypothetical protein